MRRIIRALPRVLLFFAILALILVGGQKLKQYGSENFQMIWALLWLFFSPISMAAFLLFDHIRAWFGKGKLRVDAGYLVISAVLLAMFFPPISRLCSFYVWVGSNFMFAAFIFWICLIKAFRREAAE